MKSKAPPGSIKGLQGKHTAGTFRRARARSCSHLNPVQGAAVSPARWLTLPRWPSALAPAQVQTGPWEAPWRAFPSIRGRGRAGWGETDA